MKNNQSGKRAPDGGGKAEKAKNGTPATNRPLDYQLVRALALLRGISLYREQTAN